MLDTHLFLAFVLAVTVLMLIPGPNVALIVANSVTYGFRYGLLTVAGTSSAMIVQLGLTVLGMTELLGTLGAWFEWIRWIGVAYLIYLGVAQWRAPPVNLAEVVPEPKSARAMFTRALLVSLTNPKTLFFYGAFFPQFVVTSHDVGAQVVSCRQPSCCWPSCSMAAGRSPPDAPALLAMHGRLRNRISGRLLVGAGIGLALARKS
jgi:threonine/homoserine/homoserine lactone efflux protein